ncbi:MAG TPA: hypothetical protein ENI13_00050 [candidate division CPR3 bacterium]|uniref:RNA polymerase sigma-70 region 4 domain-containing protein n=1 Tax=candidate division CPR3 bacterium TaxID=2268181 RepID=A0A7C1S909_UNCC3|nr:hypothetical protein [candidate division CPR3 bacterium]
MILNLKELSKQELKMLLNELPLSERELLFIRFRWAIISDSKKSLEETGKAFGVSRERVRQVEEKVVALINKLQNT